MIYTFLDNRVYRSYAGGGKVDRLVAGRGPEHCPEDWIASTVRACNPGREAIEEGLSHVSDGRLWGDLVSADPVGMLGQRSVALYGGQMPILVKVLDSDERLVIQAHPTVEFARKYFHSLFGKTECWYILEADEGAHVYLGFREGITREKWEALFHRQDIEEMLACLHRLPARRGDCFLVPGGVPHAIGGGTLMIELQEPTDLMVIPERKTPSGAALDERKLHGGLGFERMFDCFIYEGLTDAQVAANLLPKPMEIDAHRTLIVGKPYTDRFAMERITIRQSSSLPAFDCGLVAIVTRGEGMMIGRGTYRVQQGDRLFVPASEGRLELRGTFELILCHV